MSAEWPGILDPEVMNESIVEASHRLADAAKAGRWDVVIDLLESGQAQDANQWRFGGTSWFTPLHQAAWLGAPVEVAERLIRLGAWRSLRTADGARAVDLARKRGHRHLLEILAVPELTEREQQKFAAWDRHLADLIAERTRSLDPVSSRPVPTEVIALDQIETLWFPYPGMYGGFTRIGMMSSGERWWRLMRSSLRSSSSRRYASVTLCGSSQAGSSTGWGPPSVGPRPTHSDRRRTARSRPAHGWRPTGAPSVPRH